MKITTWAKAGTDEIELGDEPKAHDEFMAQFFEPEDPCPLPGAMETCGHKTKHWPMLVLACFSFDQWQEHLAIDSVGLHELRRELLPMMRDLKLMAWFESCEEHSKIRRGKGKDASVEFIEDYSTDSLFKNLGRIADALESRD